MKRWFIGTGLVVAGAVGTVFVNNASVPNVWLVIPIAIILLGAGIKVRYLWRCKR